MTILTKAVLGFAGLVGTITVVGSAITPGTVAMPVATPTVAATPRVEATVTAEPTIFTTPTATATATPTATPTISAPTATFTPTPLAPILPPAGGSGYINVDGNWVPSPTDAPRSPIGASAECRDGTYSFSQNRRGTCSHHGGVASWL